MPYADKQQLSVIADSKRFFDTLRQEQYDEVEHIKRVFAKKQISCSA